MCMSFVTIVIEFDTGGWNQSSDRLTLGGQPIHLVESRTGATRAFSLLRGTEPAYALTVDENSELLRLLGQIEVQAPWEARIGFDGCTYDLILKGPLTEVTFRWWLEVPQGWESVGAVADYVMSLAQRAG